MIRIKEIRNTKKILHHIKTSESRVRGGIREALFDIGVENVKHTVGMIMSGKKSGRIYRYRGRAHQASAGGEYPANRSGMLRKSIDYHVRGANQMEWGDKIFYGKFLEEGTKNMEARPHILATVEARGTENMMIIAQSVDKYIKSFKGALVSR